MRRNTWILWVAAFGWLAGSALAQERSEVELNRQMIQTQRQTIVGDNLGLTDSEAAAFWPLYRKYRAEVAGVGDQLVNLLMEYSQSYTMLTDEQATRLLDSTLKCEQEYLKLKMKWVPKFRAILPPVKVTRFFQIENKIDIIVRSEAAEDIPLAK
ncbi:MAG TPA: hypothetical protein PKN61_03095 [Acidobacteriota bacterium]|nr:hypothetical protein [Acidobacteriota bacterium]HNR37998.1 hypothetical protein [Acidobacteriota bacterium]HNU00440.1 hypothetical protein [Acidobacteriota bacterium]HPB29658.1 hypothetical protein [Acidobacteriota bacterium]HQO25832.1 hypothetical protein [Acidobacteriota bacterium]